MITKSVVGSLHIHIVDDVEEEDVERAIADGRVTGDLRKTVGNTINFWLGETDAVEIRGDESDPLIAAAARINEQKLVVGDELYGLLSGALSRRDKSKLTTNLLTIKAKLSRWEGYRVFVMRWA